MPKILRLLLCTACLHVAHAQNLPAPAEKPLEFEPQLIFSDPNAAPAGGYTTDLAKLENGLQRAKRNAIADADLFKKGILAKVEVERSEMKVVTLTSKLSDARLAVARTALENLGKDATADAKTAAESALKDAEASAKTDAEALHKAQVDAAALNLWRMQKLQGWGSVSKATVAKAQEQLATVQKQQSP